MTIKEEKLRALANMDLLDLVYEHREKVVEGLKSMIEDTYEDLDAAHSILEEYLICLNENMKIASKQLYGTNKKAAKSERKRLCKEVKEFLEKCEQDV